MLRWIPLLYLVSAVLTGPLPMHAGETAITQDETALKAATSELESTDMKVRQQAADRIRAILEQYPGKTQNIREADGGLARWNGIIALIKVGMDRSNVLKLLSPLETAARVDGNGSYGERFQLDEHWQITIQFGNGERQGSGQTRPTTANAVLGVFKLTAADRIVHGPSVIPSFTGSWITYYSNGNRFREDFAANGKLTGEYREYRQDGTLAVSEGIENGFEVFRTYSADAKLTSEKRTELPTATSR